MLIQATIYDRFKLLSVEIETQRRVGVGKSRTSNAQSFLIFIESYFESEVSGILPKDWLRADILLVGWSR